MRQKRSWEITDEFWEAAKPLIPPPERDSEKTYKRKPGGGRPPMDMRKALEGMFHIMRTGTQWKALPKEFGSSSSTRRYFRYWREKGVLPKPVGRRTGALRRGPRHPVGLAERGRLHDQGASRPSVGREQPHRPGKKKGGVANCMMPQTQP